MGRLSAFGLLIPLIGCTVYTECPAGNPNDGQGNGANGGGDSGGNGGGDAAQGGGGPAPNVPKDPWTNVTGSLAELKSECGNLAFIQAKPNEDLVLVSIALNGVWGSRDNGESWNKLGRGRGSDEITNRSNGFLFHPEDPDIFFEGGMYNGAGIYKTTDGGDTFKAVGDATHVEKFGVDFTDPDQKTLLATTHEAMRVVRTTDGGAKWDDITESVPESAGLCVSVLVLGARTHLLGCSGGIYRTEDGASTWQRVLEKGAAPSPFVSSTSAIYWPLEDGSIVKSSDDGQGWAEISGAGRIRGYPLELPDGRLAAAGWEYLVVSADDGRTWSPASSLYPYEPGLGFALTYSRHRKAFFISQHECDDSVPENGVQRYSFDYEK